MEVTLPPFGALLNILPFMHLFSKEEPSAISVFVPAVAGSLATIAVAILTGYVFPRLFAFYQNRKQELLDQQEVLSTVRLLKAEFAHVGRHSATNLMRLTEIFRSSRTATEMIVALQKMSLGQPGKDRSDATFSSVKIDNLALLPENLARDVMRLQLTARNIEIDLEDAISIFRTQYVADQHFSLADQSLSVIRIKSIARTVERCAQDSSELVDKLKNLEDSLAGQAKLKTKLGFRDEPISFSDAMSLREVGDWVHWKEEQRLIPAPTVSAFLNSALKLALPIDQITIQRQILGTINLISHCLTPTSQYCVRIRVNDDIFQYESGLVKEAFVAKALSMTDRDQFADSHLANIYRELSRPGEYVGIVPFEIGPKIHYFSPQQSISNGHVHAVLITDWMGDQLLSIVPTRSHFKLLGSSIKKLHGVHFRSYYRNFRDLGDYQFPRDFTSEIISEIRKRNDDLELVPASDMSHCLDVADAALRRAEGTDRFVLCHNDLHVNNVFIENTSGSPVIKIIDWDNACVSHKLLDFVKIKYWGTIGPGGRFHENRDYFDAFCAGYGIDPEEVLSSPIFKALSLLWLYRIIIFEKKREAGGQKIPAPFLPSQHYIPLVLALINSLR